MKLPTFLILCALSAGVPAGEPAENGQQPANAPPASSPPPTSPEESGEVVPDGAQVTISKKDGVTIEEYRVGGRLYMIKITPKRGKPYYLVDQYGDGRFARQNPMDFGIHPPMWVIKKF